MTRRTFLEATLVTAAATTSADAAGQPAPWYRRVARWGQTNLTEKDPVRYDMTWWREYWKQTQIQGVIVNAGGIVAYYPSKYPLQHQAEFLNGRDLYGEIVKAAREDGLAVLARMDSNRTSEDFFKAHPDWFARKQSSEPYRAADKYITCINSAYYDEYLPAVITEIIERTHPDGFTDNSWSGLGRDSICYCDNCRKKFKAATRQDLPAQKDWASQAYRKWIDWNYARRLEVWDLNNRVTKKVGGTDCLWIGMNSGSITAQASSFRDLKEICARSEMVLLDHQSRSDATGFQQNADTGKLVHGVLGWNKLMPESMAMYQAPSRTNEISFRLASKSPVEARMWMIEGIAGGIQPWWHHIGAYQEDRRMYRTAAPIFQWHKKHEDILLNRQPVASVGVVWSQRNTDFFGQDDAAELVELAYRGFTQALIKARIPYQPVNIEHVERQASELKVLVLPNIGALSDRHCTSICRFVDSGGSLIATGLTSLYDEWGDRRKDFALGDLFHAHTTSGSEPQRDDLLKAAHTYLRLTPEMRSQMVLNGFEDTDILPFGGNLKTLQIDSGANVPLTYIPAFPIYPPETAWMREPTTSIPGIVLSSRGQSRIAYLPADIDRRHGKDNLPDHAQLLANIVRWAADKSIPLEVKGAGLIDCHLYRQANRMILHLVNLSNEGTWRGAEDELIAIGPINIKVRTADGAKPKSLTQLVSGAKAKFEFDQNWVSFEVQRLLDHEVVVVG